MKIVHTSWLPFGRYSTINLFGVIFTKKQDLGCVVINHEAIHTAQMKEMLYIFFYIWYGLEYIIVRLFHKSQSASYHDISFEEEAYKNERNFSYLDSRKHYTWLKYIKVKSNK